MYNPLACLYIDTLKHNGTLYIRKYPGQKLIYIGVRNESIKEVRGIKNGREYVRLLEYTMILEPKRGNYGIF